MWRSMRVAARTAYETLSKAQVARRVAGGPILIGSCQERRAISSVCGGKQNYREH
jgi:hypothetical protein